MDPMGKETYLTLRKFSAHNHLIFFVSFKFQKVPPNNDGFYVHHKGRG